MKTKARDPNDILREQGEDSVRAYSDGAKPFHHSYDMNGGGATKTTTGHDVRPPMFSDDALALRFADQHVGDLRYVAEWSKWLCWNGARWQFDDTLAAFDSARAICRAAAAGCNKPKLAKELASARTRAAVVSMAREDRRLAATVEQWDAKPWFFNTGDQHE